MSSRIVASIRRNAIAWLALFVALTGTSMAASHYVITNTKQIKPSVLKKLKGNRGAAGAQGLAGPLGPTGPTGQQGQPGLNGKEGKGVTGPTGHVGATGEQGEPGPAGGPTGPTGATGEKGEKGSAGTTGATGEKGETGSGGALAYAHVSANASKVTNSVEIAKANVSLAEGEEGVYCFKGLSFTPHNVVVTIDGEEAEFPGTVTTHLGIAAGTKCPVGTQITVETWNPLVEESPGKFIEETENMGFFILVN